MFRPMRRKHAKQGFLAPLSNKDPKQLSILLNMWEIIPPWKVCKDFLFPSIYFTSSISPYSFFPCPSHFRSLSPNLKSAALNDFP